MNWFSSKKLKLLFITASICGTSVSAGPLDFVNDAGRHKDEVLGGNVITYINSNYGNSVPALTMEVPRWQSESYTPSGGTSVILRSDDDKVSGQLSRAATKVTFYAIEDVSGMTPEEIMQAHEDGILTPFEGATSNVQFAIVNFGADRNVNYEFVQHGYGNDDNTHFMVLGDEIKISLIPTFEEGGSHYLLEPKEVGVLLDQMVSGESFTSVAPSNNGRVGVVEFDAANPVREAFNQVVADLNNPDMVAAAIEAQSEILNWTSKVVSDVTADYKKQLIGQMRGEISAELKNIDPINVDVVRYSGGTGSILATTDGIRYKRPNGNTIETYGCYLKVEKDLFDNVIAWEASQTTASLTNVSCLPPFTTVIPETPPAVTGGGGGFGGGSPGGAGESFLRTVPVIVAPFPEDNSGNSNNPDPIIPAIPLPPTLLLLVGACLYLSRKQVCALPGAAMRLAR